MAIYFFDTSALQHRYVSGGKSTRSVRRAISDYRNECYISELTVLEIASAFGNRCRKQGLPLGRFDALDSAFVNDVAAGRLRVVSVSQMQLLKARHLMRFAGVIQKRRLTSADALVAFAALELAITRAPEMVTLYLDDWPLFDILRNVNAFSSALRFRFLGTPKA